MNPSAESPLAQLQTALDEAGDALACADLPKLLAAELKLGAALNSVSGIGQADRESIERARGHRQAVEQTRHQPLTSIALPRTGTSLRVSLAASP